MVTTAPSSLDDAGLRAPSAADVEAADARLDAVVRRTPLERNERLSQRVGAEVWLKREDQQVVRSYKLRGAFNFISQLSDAEKARGVECASAGNHAQGVAFSCRHLGVPGRIVVPRTTPRQKRERILAIGGDLVTLVITGDTYDDANLAAVEDAIASRRVLVPPFDHPMTIAGQGTVAVEIVRQLGAPPDVMVVPVGGGGLLAGVATWLRARHPGTRIVGIEPAGAACMAAAVAAGEPVVLKDLDSFVDGAAVRRAGSVTYPIIHDLIDELVTAEEGRVCTEMLDLYQWEGIVAEPAGALAAAALGYGLTVEPGQTVVCVLSGGNNDVSRYGEVVERSLIHEGLKHYFLVEFPQEPGALRGFLDEVLSENEDITLFEYVKKNNRETGPALVGIEINGRDDLEPLLERMRHSRLRIEPVPPGSPLFTFLVT
ncbi:MAG: threonine dehydratase [Actinomycetota bacterium]|jgi:threonine dehydratase|nr:threonine dehydratase [Actinomycetota bacterium]